MKKLLVYGAGGFGREVMELAEIINGDRRLWDIEGFVVDTQWLSNSLVNGYKTYDLESIRRKYPNEIIELAIAVGDPNIKVSIAEKVKQRGYKLATLIHPICHMSRHNNISDGCIICEGNILTTNITLGQCTILNINCTVGHDVIIGDYSTISPGCNISGSVKIGKKVYVGSGTSIRDKVEIGKDTIIGLGSVVVSNIPKNVVALGVPSKVIRANNERRVFK